MATDVVTIPKEEYDFLLKCKHVVETDFEGKFSKKFIQDIKESQKAYKKGDFVRVKNSKERKKLFDSL